MDGMNEACVEAMLHGKILLPKTSLSRKYKFWRSIKDEKRCLGCGDMHGQIYNINVTPKPEPPLHFYGRCSIQRLKTVKAGTATADRENGADNVLTETGQLPSYYISKEEAMAYEWKAGKNLAHFASGKMLAMGIYENDNKHLPDAQNRIWYEADINYYGGKRNRQRIVWSNDGLMFVTYDHYETFIEVVEE